MKARDELKTSTLRMLLSSIQYFEIAKKGTDYQATDDEVISVIQKEVKKRNEAIELYKQGDRPELAEKEQKEAIILSAYLPKQLTDEELSAIIVNVIKESGAKSVSEMGKVMGIIMPKVAGRADGGKISLLVRQKLQS